MAVAPGLSAEAEQPFGSAGSQCAVTGHAVLISRVRYIRCHCHTWLLGVLRFLLYQARNVIRSLAFRRGVSQLMQRCFYRPLVIV